MKDHYPLVIIGAGPAGLAAAVVAAEQGLAVALLDEQFTPGGQIYRAMENMPAQRAGMLGREYQRGRELVAAFRKSGVDYLPGTQVWSLNHKRELGLLRGNHPAMMTADQVLLANGALERPVAFPGWTLPGVMNAGAGQILFKSYGMVPDKGVVLAGSGPLQLLLAWQYQRAGVKIQALLDLTPVRNQLRALPHLPRALLAGHYLTRGLAYQKDLARAGIRARTRVSGLQANGDSHLESVSFRHRGRQQTIETELLLIHFGIMPHTQLSRAAGCRHDWDKGQQCWRPQLDDWGNSSIDGILIAGDGAAIGGARTAEHAGRLAAWQAVHALGLITQAERDRLASKDRRGMRNDLHIRPFLEAFFHIPGKLLGVPVDDTIVCRCEDVTAGQIRAAVADGHTDSNQVKFLTRCGMGPCQGRQCADAVAHIVAAAGGESIVAAGHYRGRPPVTPLTLGQLARLYPGEAE